MDEKQPEKDNPLKEETGFNSRRARQNYKHQPVDLCA